jgi:hypothetical protein
MTCARNEQKYASDFLCRKLFNTEHFPENVCWWAARRWFLGFRRFRSVGLAPFAVRRVGAQFLGNIACILTLIFSV